MRLYYDRVCGGGGGLEEGENKIQRHVFERMLSNIASYFVKQVV